MTTELDPIHELYLYTLAHPAPVFLHQHAVDAHTAQTASDASKPIAVVFALTGLYLYLEKGFTGRQVQKAHMQMARQRRQWPRLPLPAYRGSIRAEDVLLAAPGSLRDAAIERWCQTVWQSWSHCRGEIVELAKRELSVH